MPSQSHIVLFTILYSFRIALYKVVSSNLTIAVYVQEIVLNLVYNGYKIYYILYMNEISKFKKVSVY